MPTALALTIGDPAGIGPDITLFAWQSRQTEALPPFVLIGDPDVLAARARALGLSIPLQCVETPAEAGSIFHDALPVLPIAAGAPVIAGRPDLANAALVRHSIERAVALVQQGASPAMVTNPISKAVLYETGFPYPGHTEFLAELGGAETRPVMLLAAEELKVVPATIHIPLRDVPERLTQELLLDTMRTTSRDLRRYFGLEAPRLALCGLNPHAGEDGSLGREEIDIITPAVEAARSEGLNVTGPHSADTLFHAEARKAYDVAIAMYHDQALIPIKTLAFDRGVNVTLGLPFVRTSPDHGTAFAIAGTGKASPLSLIEALRLADRMERNARGVAA